MFCKHSKMMHFRDEDKKSISAKVIEEVDKWMERFDCLVIGPGLGRDPFLLVCKCELKKNTSSFWFKSIVLWVGNYWQNMVEK